MNTRGGTRQMNAQADADARETLRRLADAIDSRELAGTSTMRAGIAGALGALGEPVSDDEERTTDESK
jgi:hypothetical protein